MKLEIKFVTLIIAFGIALGLTGTYIEKLKPDANLLLPISKTLSVFSFLGETKQLNKIIYGFLPNWDLEQIKYIQLDKLTDIAYFGLYINKDGSFQTKLDNGSVVPSYDKWKNDPELQKLIKRSKQHNVRFAVTVISHQDDVTDSFLNCEDCWKTLVNNLKNEMDEKRIRDVNLNFEYSRYTDGDKANKYTKFTNFVNKELDKAYGNSFVVVSTFADSLVKERVTKVEDLGKVADALFIMAYDFHRPTSETAGAVAPIDGIGVRADYDIKTMLKDYLSKVPPEKLIMGIPYYGYNWVVEKDELNAKRIDGSEVTGYSESQSYAGIMDTILEVNPKVKWDEITKTPYFSYISDKTGSIREVYFDNADSLKIKYELAKQSNLAGIGIWALGYDEGYVELWKLLEKEFID